MIDLRFQPMKERIKTPGGRVCADGHRRYLPSPFKKSMGAGYDDLERELRLIGASDIVIESGHERTQIRNDGWPRSSTNPAHPDIRLFFKCKHGALRYECNAFADWQANLRAIGLWLHRQRLAIEEWGIGTGGEAYRGFAALPQAIGAAEWANAEEAARFLAKVARNDALEARAITTNPAELREVYRDAASLAHPDKPGGSAELMSKVNRAKDYIERSMGGAA